MMGDGGWWPMGATSGGFVGAVVLSCASAEREGKCQKNTTWEVRENQGQDCGSARDSTAAGRVNVNGDVNPAEKVKDAQSQGQRQVGAMLLAICGQLGSALLPLCDSVPLIAFLSSPLPGRTD